MAAWFLKARLLNLRPMPKYANPGWKFEADFHRRSKKTCTRLLQKAVVCSTGLGAGSLMRCWVSMTVREGVAALCRGREWSALTNGSAFFLAAAVGSALSARGATN